MSRIQLQKGNSLLWCLALMSLWNLTDYRIMTQYLAFQKHICDNHFSIFCNLNWMDLSREVKQYACFTGHITLWNPLYLLSCVVANSCVHRTVISCLLMQDSMPQSRQHESLCTDQWRLPCSTHFHVTRTVYNMASWWGRDVVCMELLTDLRSKIIFQLQCLRTWTVYFNFTVMIWCNIYWNIKV